MQLTLPTTPAPGAGTGFSVLMAEEILSHAQALGLFEDWDRLHFGSPARRRSAYPTRHRLAAVLAGLACGLKGIGPGNTFLRPNSALQARLGGRFPDQGTVHRWLGQVSADQAQALRDHLHQVVRRHGRFGDVLRSGRPLLVDVDGQGVLARGGRFEQAAVGYLGEGLDKGYLRYVAYAAATGEVLDEFLAPGNKTLMSQLPRLLEGLDAVVPAAYRRWVTVRGDSHLGTIGNLRDLREHHYHYLCPLQSWSAVKRLRDHVQGKRGRWFTETSSDGQVHHVEFWVVRRWRLSGKGKRRQVRTHATVYRERGRGKGEWLVLVSSRKGPKGVRLWRAYHGRGGGIEEYNDQAERAYHLEVVRTGHFAGLQALHALIGLCWNLTRWASEELRLPPLQAPQAPAGLWAAAAGLDLQGLQQRAAHSGLRLYREGPGKPLEVEDGAGTAESAAWLRWLKGPIQLLLPLTG